MAKHSRGKVLWLSLIHRIISLLPIAIHYQKNLLPQKIFREQSFFILSTKISPFPVSSSRYDNYHSTVTIVDVL